MSENLTALLVNPSNMTPMDFWNKQDPIAVKTAEIARLCGTFSGQAKTAAIIGLLLSLVAFFYFGRYREQVVKAFGPVGIIWADKVLLVSIAICFAVVITRLFYGG